MFSFLFNKVYKLGFLSCKAGPGLLCPGLNLGDIFRLYPGYVFLGGVAYPPPKVIVNEG
jgi:hypothetical protein